MNMYKYISKKVKKYDKNNELSNLWEDIYKNRFEKTKNKKKSIIAANSKVYSECLKKYLKEGNE